MKHFFYCLDSQSASQPRSSLDASFSVKLWKPTLRQIVPPGSPLKLAVWWGMHYLHIFTNREYRLLLICHDGAVVHRSVVSPRYFRFPFMDRDDLQIGDTWTSPQFRGKGLATIAVTEILHLMRKPGRRFWYLTKASNVASIRVIEKVGFKKVGEGIRTKRCGLRALGSFVIDTPLTHS